MSVIRFTLDEDEGSDGYMHILGMEESDFGEWVKYKAYQELEKKYQAALIRIDDLVTAGNALCKIVEDTDAQTK